MRIRLFFVGSCLFPAAVFGQAVSSKDEPPSQKAAPPPALAALPHTLEEMLAAALRTNPDILQAEARLQQAQARLNQARLKITQDVVTSFHEREKQRLLLGQRVRLAGNLKTMHENGRASESEYDQAQTAADEAKAQLAQVEAQLRYLLGLGGMELPPAGGAALPSAR